MKLKLKNVGKIEEATIQFNGITVIAGENNTGKSTVGKMLFCTLSTFDEIEKFNRDELVKSIKRQFSRHYYYELNTEGYPLVEQYNPAERIVEMREKCLNDYEFLKKEIYDFHREMEKFACRELPRSLVESVSRKVFDMLKFSDEQILGVLLKKYLEEEFSMKVAHLNFLKEDAEVTLDAQDKCAEFVVSRNESVTIKKIANFYKQVVYIDDPFILDSCSSIMRLEKMNKFQHQVDLLNKLKREKSSDFGLLDEYVVDKKLDSIYSLLSQVCDGELEVTSNMNTNSFLFKTSKLDDSLDITNLSTGLKSFVILRRLLQNGSIDENSVVILDEPEIHLHPDWQLKYAEIIVLIQKEFGIKIMLNTHSPYFLNAIEVYSKKYGIQKKCKYYFAQEENTRTKLIDVTERTELIYDKLASSLQVLENLEYRYGDE